MLENIRRKYIESTDKLTWWFMGIMLLIGGTICVHYLVRWFFYMVYKLYLLIN